MYDVADDVKALALAPARHIYCRAIIGSRKEGSWENDRNYYDTDHIISAKIDIGASSGGLTIGAAYSAKLTLRLMGNADIRQTDRIIMRVGFYKPDGTKAERIGLGWFYVDKISSKDNITTVTAYDKMLRGAKNYNPSALTFPCRLSELLTDVCGKMNIVMREDVVIPYDALLNEPPIKGKDNEGKPLYYTRREILGYIGSMMGGNWFLDAGGHLAFTQFKSVSGSFSAENSISAEISPDAYSVSGVTWNINGVSYSRFDADTSGMLEFKNPLSADAKEPIMGAVEKRLLGLTYHNAAIERQGCGWYELGDIVTAERGDGSSAPVLITGISYSIENGGFREKIYSSALTDSQSNYTTGDVEGQTVPQSVAQQSSGSSAGSALTEYEYLTDLSVKCNGVIYTAEKDAETGLISKISDSAGNEFEPKINTGITDIAFHNAVFMAVAIAKEIGNMFFDYFDVFWKYNQTLTLSDYPIAAIGADNMPGGLGALVRLKSYNILAGCLLSNISRGHFGLCLVVKGAQKWYKGIYPNEPTEKGSGTSFWFHLKNKKREIYFSNSPTSKHPAFSNRIKIGEKFIIENPPDFKEVFNLPMNGITDVMIYKAGSSTYYLECFFNGEKFILDNTNSRADFGASSYYVKLNDYCSTDDASLSSDHAYDSVKTLNPVKDNQYATSIFSPMLNDLEGNIFFNTFDVCDENGNVLLSKNCDLAFFIGG